MLISSPHSAQTATVIVNVYFLPLIFFTMSFFRKKYSVSFLHSVQKSLFLLCHRLLQRRSLKIPEKSAVISCNSDRYVKIVRHFSHIHKISTRILIYFFFEFFVWLSLDKLLPRLACHDNAMTMSWHCHGIVIVQPCTFAFCCFLHCHDPLVDHGRLT